MSGLSRQELYERIKASSKEEYILEEMKRLGFWDLEKEVPKASEQLREERKGLSEELANLMQKETAYRDRNKMLKEMRQERMAKAKARRTETKAKQDARRQAKAKAWAERKERDILYLGSGVSAGLSNREGNAERLQSYGLPVLQDMLELAKLLDVSLPELRFLAYRRKVSRLQHYRRFSIPKKTGGHRHISAPMPRLKAAQYKILEEVLSKVELHGAAHGFVPSRSILSNAQPHIGAAVLVNFDLKDFFPSISYRRVKGLFCSLGYSEALATPLALLCSEPLVDEVQIDGELYYLSRGEDVLPQGAATSPAITNILCRRMDARFAGLAKALGWVYTRYADDLSFSSKEGKDLNQLLWAVKQVVADEGFDLHPDKLRIMRPGQCKEVTGIVVNEKLNVSRKKLKSFRAVLHKLSKGERDIRWGQGPLGQSIMGYARFVQMVNPEKGGALVKEVEAILAAQPWIAQGQRQEPKQKIAQFSQPRKYAKEQVQEEEGEEKAAADTQVSLEEQSNSTLDWWEEW